MIPSTTLFLKLPVCCSNSISMTEWSPALSSSTLTPVLIRESLTWCQLVLLWQGWNAVELFLGIQLICMAKRDFAINCNSSDHSSKHSGVYANCHHTNWGSRLSENQYLSHSQNLWPRLYIEALSSGCTRNSNLEWRGGGASVKLFWISLACLEHMWSHYYRTSWENDDLQQTAHHWRQCRLRWGRTISFHEHYSILDDLSFMFHSPSSM